MIRHHGGPSKRGVDTAARILDVAERLVQVHGFNGFSYADISTELHIRKASLHHHFPTKAVLGKALIVRYKKRFLEALDRIYDSSGSTGAKVEEYAQIYTNVLRQERMCLCGMLAADFETLPKPMREGVTDFFNANEAWLAKVLDEGRRANEIHFDGQASTMAEFVVSSLEGAMLVARSYGKVSRFESVVKKLLANLSVTPSP